MRDLGLAATEFGPVGFLPDDPQQRGRAARRPTACSAVGGFLPVRAARPRPRPAARGRRVHRRAAWRAGAGVVVLAAATGVDGYDDRPDLDDARLATLLANLDRISDARRRAAASSPPCTRTSARWSRPARRSSGCSPARTVGLCVDTGHLLVGGADPVALTARPRRPRRATCTSRTSTPTLADAGHRRRARPSPTPSAPGCSVPLGQGDVDIAAMVRTLEAAGYQGWYVLEQDVMLDGEPDGRRPGRATCAPSLDYLRGGSHDAATDAFEVLTMGRVGVDIYPEQIGVPLEDVDVASASTSAAAPPTSPSPPPGTAAASAVITRTGDDPFGRFVHQALRGFGVDDRFVTAVAGPADAGDVLRDLPARRLPAVLLPAAHRARPADPRRRARPRRDPRRPTSSG